VAESAKNADEVALVVERTFGARLLALAESMPVWIVESAQNATFVPAARRDPLASVTTFDDIPDSRADDLVTAYLGEVLEHHPTLKRLMLLGINRTAATDEALRIAGFRTLHDGPGEILAVPTSNYRLERP